MCFSAPASFTASAGLLVIGIITITQARTLPLKVLAGIPLIFAFQQFSEGLLWCSLSGAAYSGWKNAAMYIFLVFAQVVWPVYVPFTILLFETHPGRKKILYFLLGVGILTSVYLGYCLVSWNVEAVVEYHHIRYDMDFPLANRWFSGIPYLLAAVVSPFISSLKRLRVLGLALLTSYLVTRILYQDYLISIWCYFAAVLSVIILVIVRQLAREIPKAKGGNSAHPGMPERN